MPISETYAEGVVAVTVSFGFGDFSCDPGEISQALGIVPDQVLVRGELRLHRDGKERPNPFSSWHIDSTTSSRDVNDHLRELLARLRGKAERIRPAFGEPSFGVTWKSVHVGSGPFYEPGVLAGIASFKAALYQDIYILDE